ncbi:MAG: prepilin-type N-terminal cleavage/methylation domain-containing protein [Nitrospirae bacterium]|nr:prepilin-type N-terminal cleavage/methylation domain-containing protein [Nitrospirota bacterium]
MERMLISRAGTCSRNKVRSQYPSATRPHSGLLGDSPEASRGEKSEVRSVYNGFTLIELIAVIFILSVLAGLVMPSFYELSEGSLKAETGKVASLLRYMNDSAISRKETLPLRINLDSKIICWKTPDGEKTENFKSLFEVSAASTGNVSQGEITLFFGPLGLQENLVIRMKKDEKGMLVSFNPLSGRVKIKNEG